MALFNDAKKLKVAQRARRGRYKARQWLVNNSSNKRVRGCGMTTVTGTYVTVNLGSCPTSGNAKASACNLITCGSLWLCPTCSRKVASQRSSEIANAAEAWTSQNGKKIFATFTLRHTANMSLEQVWNALSGAWKGFLSGKGWQSLKQEFNLAGWVRAVEVTHGKNGWHVHAHTIFFLQPGCDIDLNAFGNNVFCRWESSVGLQGFTADRSAFDVRRTYSDSPLSRYLSEGSNKGVGYEIANGAFKTSSTPFTILYRLVENQQTQCACEGRRLPGARCDWCLWREWEFTAKGRRQMSWSVGMRTLINFQSVPQDTDDVSKNSIPVIAIGIGSWQWLVRSGCLTDFYDCLEEKGISVAIEYLHKRNLIFECLRQ